MTQDTRQPKNNLSRRSFFRLVGGGIATAVLAPYALAKGVIEVPVEFGWTWYIDKVKYPTSLHGLITKTLQENTQKIVENIEKSNTLLAKLPAGEKILLKFEQITPEEQNKRMIERLNQRHKAKQAKRLQHKPYLLGRMYEPTPEVSCFYESYEDLEKKYG